jgi:hypothetical protein
MLEKAQQLPAHSQPIRTSFHQAAVITDFVITTAFHHVSSTNYANWE